MAQHSKKSIREIVIEEINRYFASQMMNESLDEAKSKKSGNSKKYHQTKKRIERAKKRDGKKVDSTTAQSVRDFLNDPSVNVSEIMVQATGLAPTSASSLGSKIAKGKRPVRQRLAQTIHKVQNEIG